MFTLFWYFVLFPLQVPLPWAANNLLRCVLRHGVAGFLPGLSAGAQGGVQHRQPRPLPSVDHNSGLPQQGQALSSPKRSKFTNRIRDSLFFYQLKMFNAFIVEKKIAAFLF